MELIDNTTGYTYNLIENNITNEEKINKINIIIKKNKLHKFLIDIDIIKDNQTITDIYSLYINNKIIKREINNDIVNFYYGLYYRYIKKDYELTEHYYLKAIVNFNNNPLRELAFYYYKIKMDYDKMKYYLNIAIDMYNDDRSMFIFGSYYQTIEKNYDLMTHS